jgi:hypothetical protein
VDLSRDLAHWESLKVKRQMMLLVADEMSVKEKLLRFMTLSYFMKK